jgi:aspartyl-tRNA(Asn)/glutamyl-tRNA(Gln) amidotransferase subunit A
MALLPNFSFCSSLTRRSSFRLITCSSLSTSSPPQSPSPSSSSSSSSSSAEKILNLRPHSEILRIRESLLSREKSAVEIAEDYLSRLKEREPKLKSFLFVSDEHAIREAQLVDKKLAANEPLGPLAGVPFAIKDNLCTADMPSTGGSKILEHYRPPFDATAVRKMKDAGALTLGKTNLDEFGMGSSTEGSAFQVLHSALSLHHVGFFVPGCIH